MGSTASPRLLPLSPQGSSIEQLLSFLLKRNPQHWPLLAFRRARPFPLHRVHRSVPSLRVCASLSACHDWHATLRKPLSLHLALSASTGALLSLSSFPSRRRRSPTPPLFRAPPFSAYPSLSPPFAPLPLRYAASPFAPLSLRYAASPFDPLSPRLCLASLFHRPDVLRGSSVAAVLHSHAPQLQNERRSAVLHADDRRRHRRPPWAISTESPPISTRNAPTDP